MDERLHCERCGAQLGPPNGYSALGPGLVEAADAVAARNGGTRAASSM